MKKIKVAFFPYGLREENPYQKLLKEAIEFDSSKNIKILKWSGIKWFPYVQTFFKKSDIIHHFWPHNFYTGRNMISTFLKNISFNISLLFLRNRNLIYSVENLVSHDCHNFDFEVKQIQKLINNANGLIFMSKASKQIFEKNYIINRNTKVLILPHINYLSHYKNEISREDSRKKFNIKSDDKVLLTLGRIDRYKGIVDLIKSFSSIKNKQSVLLIAGRCSDKEYSLEIENEIIKAKSNGVRVIFDNGFIHDDDLQIYHNAADGVVLNYKDAPMNPGSLIMSMGFGCSIVAPDIGAIPEIVPEESFFGFNQNDKKSFNNALSRFLSSNNLVEKSSIAKKTIIKNHSKENINNKLNKFYKQINNT